jgi:hypothetical protein
LSLNEANIIKITKLNSENTAELEAPWLSSTLKRGWFEDKLTQEANHKSHDECASGWLSSRVLA